MIDKVIEIDLQETHTVWQVSEIIALLQRSYSPLIRSDRDLFDLIIDELLVLKKDIELGRTECHYVWWETEGRKRVKPKDETHIQPNLFELIQKALSSKDIKSIRERRVGSNPADFSIFAANYKEKAINYGN